METELHVCLSVVTNCFFNAESAELTLMKHTCAPRAAVRGRHGGGEPSERSDWTRHPVYGRHCRRPAARLLRTTAWRKPSIRFCSAGALMGGWRRAVWLWWRTPKRLTLATGFRHQRSEMDHVWELYKLLSVFGDLLKQNHCLITCQAHFQMFCKVAKLRFLFVAKIKLTDAWLIPKGFNCKCFVLAGFSIVHWNI